MSSDRSDQDSNNEDTRRRRRLGGGYNAPEEPSNSAKNTKNEDDEKSKKRQQQKQQQQEQFMNAIPNIVVRVDDDDDDDDEDGGRRRRRRLDDDVVPNRGNNASSLNNNNLRSVISSGTPAISSSTTATTHHQARNHHQYQQQGSAISNPTAVINNNNNNHPYDVSNYSNAMSSISLLPLPAEQVQQEKTLAALSIRKNRFASSAATSGENGSKTSSSSTIPAIGVHGLAETRNLLFSKIDFLVTKEHLLSIIGTLLGEERMKSNPVLNVKRKEIELTIESDGHQQNSNNAETGTKSKKEKMTFVRNTEQVELEFLKVRDAVIVHNAMNGGIINGRKISVDYI